MEKEIWKDIKGYEGYYKISSYGNVKSLSRIIKNKNSIRVSKDVIIKPCYDKRGYERVKLQKNKTKKNISIHRLVALHFIPNPENKPQVNHIDGIKTNNNYTNLEWNTPKENVYHAKILGLTKYLSGKHHYKSLKICKYSLNGELIKIYNSMKEAQKDTGVFSSTICRVCKGEFKQSGGFIWKYLNNE